MKNLETIITSDAKMFKIADIITTLVHVTLLAQNNKLTLSQQRQLREFISKTGLAPEDLVGKYYDVSWKEIIQEYSGFVHYDAWYAIGEAAGWK